MKTALITGGAGFFGEILKRNLIERQVSCVSIDLQPDPMKFPLLTSVQGDIRDPDLMRKIFSSHRFDVVFHCAAMLSHGVKDQREVWSHNVDGTRAVADMAAAYRVPKVIYISSSCLWGRPFGRPILEDDPPAPVDVYGQSKWEGEKILLKRGDAFTTICIRCPVIMDSGRLGLSAILFQFIDEGRKVWIVGNGNNRYQFVYAQDAVDACLRAVEYEFSDIFNVGSKDVKSLRDIYQYVIDHAGSGARIVSLPKKPALLAMGICNALGISPLGPYQYKMIAEDFEFDTSKIQRVLGWAPTMTNEQMLLKAYQYYHDNRDEINSRTNVSAHKQPTKMGIINLMRWLS